MNYKVIEKTSNKAFQAIRIEMPFAKKKNVICGVTYRQHNSPDLFQRNLLQQEVSTLDKPY